MILGTYPADVCRVVSVSSGDAASLHECRGARQTPPKVARNRKDDRERVSTSAILELIKKEFGTRERIIERAIKSSESFRSLCRDYRDCALALARCRESESEEAVLRAVEYSELLVELADEIEARLQAVGTVTDDNSQSERKQAEDRPSAGNQDR
jgi:hypothetical protein